MMFGFSRAKRRQAVLTSLLIGEQKGPRKAQLVFSRCKGAA
jgi:hypothetical protein